MKKLMIVLTLIASTALTAGPAYAALANANLSVSATVINNCSVVANALSFGNYENARATDLDATTTIVVTCITAGLALTIAADDGANQSGADRRMTVNGEFLTYNLYREVGRTTVWGDGAGFGAGTIDDTSIAGDVTKTIYGRIPANQDVTAGNYTDTVAVTVNW